VTAAGILAKATLGTGVASLALVAGAVRAQDVPGQTAEAESDEVIVVTGTSIRGVAPVGAPVLGIGEEEIQLQPTSTTTELLRQVPAVLSLGASEGYVGEANNANANITAGNGINLRGLGTAATLTLLNGRRLPASGVQGQYFDPSVFATTGIGRIEVMADGGSAIYGSDAVGGVVNILTRRNYDGAEAYVRQGFADDVSSTEAGAIVGRRWSGGGVMLSYEYQIRDALLASDRDLHTDDLRAYGGADFRLTTSSPGNIRVGSTLYPIPAGQDGTALSPSDLQPASSANPANLESRYKDTTAIPGQERHSFLGRLDQEISSGISTWVEGFYAHRQAEDYQSAATATLSVPDTNAFFVAPAGVTLPLCAASAGAPAGTTCETILYSFSNDLGPRIRDAFSEVYQIAGGVDVELGGSWGLSAYASYGQDIESRTQYTINNAQLAAALRDPNPATAFNPFGDQGATNPATLDRIRGAQTVATRAKLVDFNVKLDGSLFSLPGGDLRVAVGGEYQVHDWRYHVLDSARTPDAGTFAETLSYGDRDVKSVYLEGFIPVVGPDNAMPGVQELSISAAVRYDDYSDFGSTTNPKFALSYVPVEGVTLRGTYGTSFRAPTLSDIDPANIVTLIENFVDPTSPTGTTRTLFVRGSNTTDLGPEEATIWSLGLDLAPVAVPEVRVSLTYFNVDYKNRIENPGSNRSALTSAVEPLLGNLVTRNPSTALVQMFMDMPGFSSPPEDPANIGAIVDGRKVNVGQVQTDGLEGSISYQADIGAGTLSAGVIGAYFFKFDQAIFPAAPVLDVVNTFGNPLEFRLRGNLGYTTDRFSAVAYVNHAGGYTNNAVTPEVEVPSYTTFDLGLRYRLTPGVLAINEIELSLDVQNLFDRDPPIVLTPTPLPYDGQVANLMGRYVKVGLRTRW
jgi:iron complex outermembrane receptor protein